MKLNAKVALTGTACVLVTAVALVFLAVWQSREYNGLAQIEVDSLVNADLDHIAQGVLHLVRTENEAVQAQIDGNLKMARHFLDLKGGARLTGEKISWRAENQFTGESRDLLLPKLLFGDTWCGRNADFEVETPLVDKVASLVGASVTVFQKMNEQGDMLRVATTVRTKGNQRAIGTFVPANNSDGSANPVIAAILRGESYHGRAFVVNDWYLTACEPILDDAGRLVGMLHVGLRQHAVADRIRQVILQTNVGKTGYVYVLEGHGQHRGRYVISSKGSRDGEDIWSTVDSDGRFIIQEIIQMATLLHPGELGTIRYRWQNPGEPAPRWKMARLAYFAPWDWVIGTSAYEDELQAYRNFLLTGRQRMVHIMSGAAFVITLLVVLAGTVISWTITRPIRQMTAMAERIIEGDLTQTMEEYTGRDEIGLLARTFNHMTGELKRNTATLREREEEFRGIFENAMEGVFQSSLEGRFLKVNPAFAELLGYESPEALMEAVSDIRHQFYVRPEERDQLLAIIGQQKKISGFEVQCYRRDGSMIWISASAGLRSIRAGGQTVVEGFITDITARKRAEEALAESKDYLDEIINSVGDPIFVKDERHQWVLLNDAMCAFMGRSRNELLGKSDYDFFPKDQVDVFWEKDQAVLDSGLANLNEELFTDAQGHIHTILTKKTLYVGKKGDRFIVGIVRDLTEQKRAEEEKLRLEARLSQSQKMEAIGTLAGGIAHDFNNILQPMLSYSELLKNELAADSPFQQYLDRIYSAGLRAKDLVNQILAFSRQAEHSIQPVRIQTGLKEILKLCRSTIPTSIAIKQDIQEDCPPVLLDPIQLHQVVMNLIINAYHAVDQGGGEISVTLKEADLSADDLADSSLSPGPYAVISIADSGCGIDPAIRNKIFEPYFTTKGQGKGTGLGLAVVYGIVSDYHGDIRVETEVGRGTTMTVLFPITDQTAEARPPEQNAGYPTGNERILLIDDEELIVEVGRLVLEGLGYQVTCLRNSAEALERFRSDPEAFDLVITDMTMPNMTGDRLAMELLAIRPDLPIIICSGFSERISREQAKGIGVREFLRKPITLLEISHKVRAALDEPCASQTEDGQEKATGEGESAG
ncbi:MAG: Cache 3/Cache 2 fusion domain-containing protein [Desulfobulbus sp.]